MRPNNKQTERDAINAQFDEDISKLPNGSEILKLIPTDSRAFSYSDVTDFANEEMLLTAADSQITITFIDTTGKTNNTKFLYKRLDLNKIYGIGSQKAFIIPVDMDGHGVAHYNEDDYRSHFEEEIHPEVSLHSSLPLKKTSVNSYLTRVAGQVRQQANLPTDTNITVTLHDPEGGIESLYKPNTLFSATPVNSKVVKNVGLVNVASKAKEAMCITSATKASEFYSDSFTAYFIPYPFPYEGQIDTYPKLEEGFPIESTSEDYAQYQKTCNMFFPHSQGWVKLPEEYFSNLKVDDLTINIVTRATFGKLETNSLLGKCTKKFHWLNDNFVGLESIKTTFEKCILNHKVSDGRFDFGTESLVIGDNITNTPLFNNTHILDFTKVDNAKLFKHLTKAKSCHNSYVTPLGDKHLLSSHPEDTTSKTKYFNEKPDTLNLNLSTYYIPSLKEDVSTEEDAYTKDGNHYSVVYLGVDSSKLQEYVDEGILGLTDTFSTTYSNFTAPVKYLKKFSGFHTDSTSMSKEKINLPKGFLSGISDGDTVVITVGDNGIQIDSDFLKDSTVDTVMFYHSYTPDTSTEESTQGSNRPAFDKSLLTVASNATGVFENFNFKNICVNNEDNLEYLKKTFPELATKIASAKIVYLASTSKDNVSLPDMTKNMPYYKKAPIAEPEESSPIDDVNMTVSDYKQHTYVSTASQWDAKYGEVTELNKQKLLEDLKSQYNQSNLTVLGKEDPMYKEFWNAARKDLIVEIKGFADDLYSD